MIPVVVGQFMAEMADQGAVRFVEGFAMFFAIIIIGFGDIEGDEALGVAGDDGRAIGDGFEEIEGEAGLRFFVLRDNGEAEVEEIDEDPAFGGFDVADAPDVLGQVEVGDGAGESAGEAEGMGGIGGNEPVAGGGGEAVGAEAEGSGRLTGVVGAGPGIVSGGLQGAEGAELGVIAQLGAAIKALGVGEEERLAAGAFEGLHKGRTEGRSWQGMAGSRRLKVGGDRGKALTVLNTVKAVVRGDHIQWKEAVDHVLSQNRPTDVLVTILEGQPNGPSAEEKSQRRISALQDLANQNALSTMDDPVAWQRKARADRELPGRES